MAGDTDSADVADEAEKQALLDDARQIMAFQRVPPVFVDRLLDIVRENFEAKEIRGATPAEIRKGPVYVLVSGLIVSWMGSMLVQSFYPDWPQLLVLGVAACIAIISTLIALRMVLRNVEDKRVEDDALAMLGRVYDSNLSFSLQGFAWRGQFRRLRHRPPRNTAEVDDYLRKWGWKNAGGRTFLFVAVVFYAVFLIVGAFQI